MAFTPLILLSTVAAGVPSKETILDTAGPLLWAYYIPSSPSPTSFNRSYIDLFYIPPLRVVPTRPWISPLGLVLHHHHHSGSRCSPARVAPEIWPDRAVFFFPLGAERLSIADDQALRTLLTTPSPTWPRARKWMMLRILGEARRGFCWLAKGGRTRCASAKGAHAGLFSISLIPDLLGARAFLVSKLWDQEPRDDMTWPVPTSRPSPSTSGCWSSGLNRTTLDITSGGGPGSGELISTPSIREVPETPLLSSLTSHPIPPLCSSSSLYVQILDPPARTDGPQAFWAHQSHPLVSCPLELQVNRESRYLPT